MAVADLDLTLRSETGGPLNATQHDANFAAIQAKANELAGHLNELAQYGNMFQVGNAVATVISGASTWVLVENFGLGHVHAITFDAGANALVLTAGDWLAVVTVSFVSAGAAKDFEFALALDGTPVSDYLVRTRAASTDPQAVSLAVPLIGVTAGQELTLMVQNLTDATNCTVVHASVLVTKQHD